MTTIYRGEDVMKDLMAQIRTGAATLYIEQTNVEIFSEWAKSIITWYDNDNSNKDAIVNALELGSFEFWGRKVKIK